MENINSCCFVAKISDIKPIEGADKIVLAVINGWNCIVQKDQYNIGDLVICATTDAVIPQLLAEHLNVINYLRKGNRVKTIKLKGVYSECLLIPISIIESIYPGLNADAIPEKIEDGTDLMSALQIFKFEPPVKMVQLASGKKIRYSENPNFQIYYKFPNIKNVPGIFIEEDEVQITRKLHGTNARYGIVKKNKLSLLDKILKFIKRDKWIDYEFIVGSHNVEKGSDSQGFYDTNVWYEIADKYKIKEKLWNYVKKIIGDSSKIGSGVTIFGEIYGQGIQKGYDYDLKELKFAAFDIVENGEYLSTDETLLMTTFVLDLPHVEILYKGKWSQEIQDSFVYDNFIPNSKVPHEGIVIKHKFGKRDKVAKVINPAYLIYGEKNNIGDSH
jgi:RNA ligase (TIGR02306 family)